MLTPEEIEARDFLISLRGYDREEVHDFLGQVADRVRELQERIEELETDAAVSAQRAADAEQTAELTIPEAAAEATAPAADASGLFAEIGRETQRILEAAQEAAEHIRNRAREDADRELQSAREQAAGLLADGERRLEETGRAVAQLKDARSALAGDLLGVSRTIDQLLRELGPEGEAAQPGTGVETLAEAGGGPMGAPDVAPPGPPGQAPAAGASAEPAAEAPEPAESGVGSEGGTPVVGEAAGEAGGGAAAGIPAGGSPQELRAAVLSPLHPKLVRSLRRGLQELQNVALDRLRRAQGRRDLEAHLPEEEKLQGLREVADGLLMQAYQGGARTASQLAGRSLPQAATSRDLDADFLGEVAERLRGSLQATLRSGLDANEALPALSDRVGRVFGELKGPRAEELAASHLVHAYELGLLDVWSAGGVSHRRWVLGKEPRCPESRCRHNERSGPLPVGQSFPSGHDVPPVHVGCTCTTLPAGES